MRALSAATLICALALTMPAATFAEPHGSEQAASGTTEVTVRSIDSERTVTPGGLPATGGTADGRECAVALGACGGGLALTGFLVKRQTPLD